MATASQKTPATNNVHHKRSTSTVLKSITQRNRQRSPSLNSALDLKQQENKSPTKARDRALPSLPLPSTALDLPLSSLNQNVESSKPGSKKPIEVYDEEKNKPNRSLKKEKGTRTVLSFGKRDKEKSSKIPDQEKLPKPKKSKSSTSLSALLSRPKSSRTLNEDFKILRDKEKEKENHIPPGTAEAAPPPIWAQFATQAQIEFGSSMKAPLNDNWNVQDEISLYTPKDYSPSKKRDFREIGQPTLSKRPVSTCVSSEHQGMSFAERIAGVGKTGFEKGEAPGPNSKKSEDNKKIGRRLSMGENHVLEDGQPSRHGEKRRESKVMAAVASWNDKAKDSAPDSKQTRLDANVIETQFEVLLDSRNISQNLRDKMRSLDTSIKADFIKQERTGSASSTDGLALQTFQDNLSSRPQTGRSKTENIASLSPKGTQIIDETSGKKPRPRSLTFTLSKGDQSPTKKQKPERPVSHVRAKSTDLAKSSSSTSLASLSATQGLAFIKKKPKPAVPEEFISYLESAQKVEVMEVGRLHKLRQLLRNETVTWVDIFITNGGMKAIINLLYRIIDVEWREEHEDALLHETLLCLKALSTTSLALSQLYIVQGTLFPTLIKLLFDPEKKGPSEFTTRSVIFSLLFTSLSSCPTPSQARTILSYLRDPTEKEAQLPGFIASIYVPRPYRVWCKEIVDVTKEVFWIFLHHHNIVPYPELSSPSAGMNFSSVHFPQARSPVPAAPYVGGVEWDATNYLASHLDLLNAIIACLPICEERNALRQELKDSGFEKAMGGSLRTCKEKFYGAVHAGLATWIGAAREDRWDSRMVKEGPPRDNMRTPKKKNAEPAPMLQMPDLDIRDGEQQPGGGWL